MSDIMKIEQPLNNEEIEIVTASSDVFNENNDMLKVLSENLPKEAELPTTLESGGLFGLFKHKVCGEELNRLTESIQDKMIEQNKVIVKTKQDVDTFWNSLTALDKDYLQRTQLSLKTAVEANAKALKAIDGVKESRNEINQIINQQKQIIEVTRVLKDFKEDVEKIEHLTDVDEIFADLSTMQSNTKIIESEVTNNKTDFENSIKKINEEIAEQKEIMSTYLESELSRAKGEITELRLLIGNLTKVLKTTRVISFASIAITCVLVILIISGVL